MQSVSEFLKAAKNRNWTTTEELDICDRPEFHNATEVQGWCVMEEDRLETQVGDTLEPIDDNLYIIRWAEDLHSEYGEFSMFGNLQQALDLFFNHK